MARVRVRPETGLLYFDFQYLKKRCREQTDLKDTPENRRVTEDAMRRIAGEIQRGVFKYRRYFPNSRQLEAVERLEEAVSNKFSLNAQPVTREGHSTRSCGYAGASTPPSRVSAIGVFLPTFSESCDAFIEENKPLWKESNLKTKLQIVESVLKPIFGHKRVDQITRQDILEFRSKLAKDPSAMTGKSLSPSRVNHVMTCLKQVIDEAADRHHFTTPFYNIKRLKEPKTDVNPFTPAEINLILENCRPDYRDFFTIRFFTGMRSAELFGLKWEFVNFDRRVISIRTTIVEGREETPKTEGSIRDIRMTPQVYDALVSQYQLTGHLGGYVFCNALGSFMCNKNFTNRIWYPLLSVLGIKKRKPYQTRHTYATMMLAAGEAPEFIANQMGHNSTEMLFTVYSRYVPNLTRNDGSAFERMLDERLGGGANQAPTHAPTQVALPAPTPIEPAISQTMTNKASQSISQPMASAPVPRSLVVPAHGTQPHQLIPPLPPEEAKPKKPPRSKIAKPVSKPTMSAGATGEGKAGRGKQSMQQQAVWAEMFNNMTRGDKS